MKVKCLYVQDLVKAREVDVSQVATETNWQTKGRNTCRVTHQEFDGEELRERDDVANRLWRAKRRIRQELRRRSARMMLTNGSGNSWNLQTSQAKQLERDKRKQEC